MSDMYEFRFNPSLVAPSSQPSQPAPPRVPEVEPTPQPRQLPAAAHHELPGRYLEEPQAIDSAQEVEQSRMRTMILARQSQSTPRSIPERLARRAGKGLASLALSAAIIYLPGDLATSAASYKFSGGEISNGLVFDFTGSKPYIHPDFDKLAAVVRWAL